MGKVLLVRKLEDDMEELCGEGGEAVGREGSWRSANSLEGGGGVSSVRRDPPGSETQLAFLWHRTGVCPERLSDSRVV